MANQPNTLAGYISQELVGEFDLGESNESLDRFSGALARAVSRFLGDDIEVAVGQQVAGQGVADDGEGGTINTEVTGQVTTKGKLV